MLSYKNRFHGHGSLRYVYKNGRAARSHLITVKYTANPHRKHSRVAIVVSKKVLKSAVGRNRVRRRLYEMVRLRLDKIPRATDLAIIVVSSEVAHLPHPELEASFDQLLEGADLYKKAI